MARSGGPQNLTDGIETMLSVLPRANLEDGTARAIRSLLHREMTGKISARSAQMAMARLVPPLESARIVQSLNLDEIERPTTPKKFLAAMRAIWTSAVKDGRCGLYEARKAMILTKTLYRAEREVGAALAIEACEDGYVSRQDALARGD